MCHSVPPCHAWHQCPATGATVTTHAAAPIGLCCLQHEVFLLLLLLLLLFQGSDGYVQGEAGRASYLAPQAAAPAHGVWRSQYAAKALLAWC